MFPYSNKLSECILESTWERTRSRFGILTMVAHMRKTKRAGRDTACDIQCKLRCPKTNNKCSMRAALCTTAILETDHMRIAHLQRLARRKCGALLDFTAEGRVEAKHEWHHHLVPLPVPHKQNVLEPPVQQGAQQLRAKKTVLQGQSVLRH